MNRIKPILRFLQRSLVFPPVWIVAYLFFAYHSVDFFIRTGYGTEAKTRLNMLISTQKSLLNVTLHGQTKEQVIASVKSVLDRPEHRRVKLEIGDNVIRIGKTNIYFTDGKVSVVD
jgi:hypothetical protein